MNRQRPTPRSTQPGSRSSEQSPSSDAATRLDRLAESLLAGLEPVRYDVARTEAERDDVFRLRYRAVIDRGWGRPDDFPDGRERDDDDDRAVLIGAWDGTQAIAAARMIFPVAGKPLPVERIFGIEVEPRGRVVHYDRVTVDRAHRDGRSRLLLGLLARSWLEMRARGYQIWAGIDSAGMLRLYRRLGFELTVLGQARRYWNEDRVPVRYEPIAVADEIIDRLGERT